MGDYRTGANSFDPPPGMLRKGSIVGYDAPSNTIQVELTESPAIRGRPFAIPVPHSFTLLQSDGIFMGALPSKNTTITLANSTGGEYHVVGFEPEQTHLSLIPNNLTLGDLLLHTTDTSEVLLDTDGNIRIGSAVNYIHMFAGEQPHPETNLITINFNNENHFTRAYREIGGVVKRDLRPNPQAASYTGDTKLEDDSYDAILTSIGLDPTFTTNTNPISPTRNPAFVEHRELVHEFQNDVDIDDDITEASKYGRNPPKKTIFTTPNRRKNRSDTMSLSMVAPNYLMEEVKGTVIDIFGNILDINRVPLPVGLSANTTLRSSGTTAKTDGTQSYTSIRALERKSIAFHFEINARKDPNLGSTKSTVDNKDYNSKLLRSRFFFDIDKEGQFKLNVPASSETGNVPLLVRPENYSTFGHTDNDNPNQTWFVKSGQPISQDIFVDSFAAPQQDPSASEPGFGTLFDHGSVKLIDGDTNTDVGPPDRISQFVDNSPFNIRHGTAHHDLLATCSLHQNNDHLLNYQLGTTTISPLTTQNTQNLPLLKNIVSDTIKVSGAGANAGGRSGSVNLDGSLELNIGANTVDRQSLWLDTAGGMVANVGRDNNNKSAIVNFDGDVYIQIGGLGLATHDSRFTNKDGVQQNGTLDIRIFSGTFAHLIRVDPQTGVSILSPQSITIYAAQGINMHSDHSVNISSDQLYLNGRLVFPEDSPGVSTSI